MSNNSLLSSIANKPPNPSEDSKTHVPAKRRLFEGQWGNREEEERSAQAAKKRKQAAAAKTAKFSNKRVSLVLRNQLLHRKKSKPQVHQQMMDEML